MRVGASCRPTCRDILLVGVYQWWTCFPPWKWYHVLSWEKEVGSIENRIRQSTYITHSAMHQRTSWVSLSRLESMGYNEAVRQ